MEKVVFCATNPMKPLIDTYRHKGLRKRLAEEVRSKGIRDERVLQAIETIPRHFFLDSSFVEFAYQDKPFPIGSGQTISQPYTVAFQTELLSLKKGEKVLEIGTGSGYQACVLVEMGARVFSVERHHGLYLKTRKLLEEMKYRPRLFYGDGYRGLPAFAPFDKILVTAAAPYIPEPLIQQLNPGGVMVIPVGRGQTQTMMRVTRISDTEVSSEECGYFRFVPMLENKAE